MKEMMLFPREIEMYTKIIPKMEFLYKEKGQEIHFSPKFYPNTGNSIILEDLREIGFKNADRLKGLDLDHCKAVLTQMAFFHAASAVLFERNGDFDNVVMKGVYTEDNRAYVEAFNESLYAILRKCMELSYENGSYFAAKVCKSSKDITNAIINVGQIDYTKFNVINHGDCWTNNIMFKYDKNETEVLQCLFIDFQYCKYGSPSQDLYYFILSSAETDIKIKKFDYLIKWYYDKLIENLTLLEYRSEFPKLIDIHLALYEHGMWAIMTVVGIMGAALLDPTDQACMDNFFKSDEIGDKFKMAVYGNKRYIDAMNQLLPWMDCRGILDHF